MTLNNEVLTSACGNVKARPTGVNSTFPPLQSSGNSEGFHVEWDLGEDGVLAIELKPNLVVIQALEAFTRWVGVMEGGIVAQETKYTGAIIFEEFRLLL